MNNLKILQINSIYTQTQLAHLLGVGERVITDWALGSCKPNLGQIIALCRILDCSPIELYRDKSIVHSGYIPVYSGDDIYFTDSAPLPRRCDFGIVLDNDINERFSAGDICYFEICESAVTGSLVIIFDDENRVNIEILKDGKNVSAACRYMKSKI